MKTKLSFFYTLFLVFNISIAQELLSPSFTFSHKKTAYLTLNDGSELTCTIKDIDRKKGLIEEIKIVDGAGKKHKFDPTDIKFMYLPPSGFDKLSKTTSTLTKTSNWTDKKLNNDLLSNGYIYFELADVKIKKKTLKLLVQLLNPSFSSVIKVYHDPYAKETMSLGVGPIDVAGGIAKSYYISKNNEAAFRLKKKDYDEQFIPFWNKCDKVISEFPDKKWRNLTQHIITYSECVK